MEDEAVTLMQAGLHAHLLRLIRAAVPVFESRTMVWNKLEGEFFELRSFFALQGVGLKREREESGVENQASLWLTRGSLRVAVSKNGKNLLRDDLPLQREKLLLLD